MASRVNLQIELESVLGRRNVYFQPPANTRISYPAIIYNLSDISTKYANNKSYIGSVKYTITHIHKDPDENLFSEMSDAFILLQFDRRFVSDNLYHDVYSLFY